MADVVLGPWFSSYLTSSIGSLAVGSIEHGSFVGREVTAFASTASRGRLLAFPRHHSDAGIDME
jgi:hypothetical protein